ncbi:MAG: glycerol-3-phosphate dehydrogenase/oxidase [Paracoccus sp. (in: a-proteobacteria)]|uniref:glycerol-3-phosphate dehydrogenase/oxidase n=5 Tax=Paracoccus TaxID=265 RepID=UPI0017BBBAE2|nr:MULTISPECIES: glycerol-3-phosphate dehydrogenase/oxidase [unclassified Paracoccus (in: a-proteobacteria)]HIC66680.1 glycerol-3-phosphate dehydrogenase/oxidase [Paracoccus sp. (in: a-proteobacteria)]|tara:strand:+ start:1361 stop:3019 length:1659 start_codon:yes stop_codon:yes gene_type:complete
MTDPHDIDVLILGAGINGAGLFRDLCEQGASCVIADKGDFGGGTSAAPSRLIHGGIKYLETGELRLVAQSTYERNLLLRNAPHLVRPLPTVIPIFSWLRGIGPALRTLLGSTTAPRGRGAVLIKIGLAIYDLYGRRARVMPRHQLWSRARALREIPPLTPRIAAAGRYYDAMVTQPERLVWELLADGIRVNPAARALNYTTLQDTDGTTIRLTGPDGTLALRPRIVVNAAGPWIDRVNAALGAPSRLIGGTRGSHLLLDHPDLLAALNGRMLYFEADDGRICLVFDYLGRALVGSTDLRADDPDTVACDEAEVDYLLGALRGLLPGLRFGREQIVYAYSGIRPLPASDAAMPGLISRDHSAPVAEPQGPRVWPILSLVGGKWTTFRGFAEEVADEVLARLSMSRRIGTASLAIGGGRDFPADPEVWANAVAARTGCAPDRARDLLDRYGTTAGPILAAEGPAPAMLADAAYSLAELDWLIRHERVRHLADLVMRRTAIAVTGRLTGRDLDRIAGLCARALDWDDTRRRQEIADTRAMLTGRHRLRMDQAASE